MWCNTINCTLFCHSKESKTLFKQRTLGECGISVKRFFVKNMPMVLMKKIFKFGHCSTILALKAAICTNTVTKGATQIKMTVQCKKILFGHNHMCIDNSSVKLFHHVQYLSKFAQVVSLHR